MYLELGVENQELDSIFNTAVDFEWDTKVSKTFCPASGTSIPNAGREYVHSMNTNKSDTVK